MNKRVGFTFPGSKIKLAPTILSFLPKQGRKWIDVFSGKGNVTFAAILAGYQYEEFVLNDIRTYSFFEALREYGDRIAVPHRDSLSDEDFAMWRRKAKQGDAKAALLMPYLSWCGSGTGSRTQGGYQSPQAYRRNLRAATILLRQNKVRISRLDWLDCLKKEQVGPGDTVFLDPPYIGAKYTTYGPADILPIELIDYLQGAKHAWALTEFNQPLYLAGLGQPVWSHQMVPPNPGHKNKLGRVRTECIWVGKGTR